jgi:cyclohexyl-isocyanide hydratase
MPPPLEIVFVAYPGITQLDFTGPYEVLCRLPGATCTLASREGGLLRTPSGLCFAELVPLREVAACSVLCVAGGYGTIEALDDEALLFEIQRLGKQSQYVTSVCTGSLLLGAAGLLRGKRAASHWAWRDLLSAFGAVPDSARVVRDGHVITGGGVTAGIDLALTIAAEIAGVPFAQAIQLAIEYAPAPPFDAGRPELAPDAVVQQIEQRLLPLRAGREAAVARAAARPLALHPVWK